MGPVEVNIRLSFGGYLSHRQSCLISLFIFNITLCYNIGNYQRFFLANSIIVQEQLKELMNLQAFSLNGDKTMEFHDWRLEFLADTATGLMYYDVADVTSAYGCTGIFGFSIEITLCQFYQAAFE